LAATTYRFQKVSLSSRTWTARAVFRIDAALVTLLTRQAVIFVKDAERGFTWRALAQRGILDFQVEQGLSTIAARSSIARMKHIMLSQPETDVGLCVFHINRMSIRGHSADVFTLSHVSVRPIARIATPELRSDHHFYSLTPADILTWQD